MLLFAGKVHHDTQRLIRACAYAVFNLTRDMLGEARMIQRAFGIGNTALADAVALLDKHL